MSENTDGYVPPRITPDTDARTPRDYSAPPSQQPAHDHNNNEVQSSKGNDMSEDGAKGYGQDSSIPPVPEAPDYARYQPGVGPAAGYGTPSASGHEAPQAPAGYQTPASYNAPQQHQNQPYGSAPDNQPQYGYNAPQGAYEGYPQGQNGGYYQNPPANPYAGYQGGGPSSVRGSSEANLAMIFGILGIVILPIVFGPLALWQASKAKQLGNPATAGTILGWVNIAMVAIGAILFVLFFIGSAASGGTSV